MPFRTNPNIDRHLAFPLVPVRHLFVFHLNLGLYPVEEFFDNGPLGI
jgi:hypothetical protein